jgi:hypothetical protein
MKDLSISIISILLLFSFYSCKKDNVVQNNKDGVLLIILEQDYKNDSVMVSFNNIEIARKRVTTNFSIDVAWSSGILIKPQALYSIFVANLDSGISKEFNFSLKDTTEVDIRYDRQSNSFSYSVADHIFMRD